MNGTPGIPPLQAGEDVKRSDIARLRGEDVKWIRAEAGRRGMSISAFLTEVLADARARVARSEGEK